MWRCTTSQSKALDAVLLAACKKILCCSSKTCSEAVWGDLGIEPLDLRKKKRKVVWFLRLLKKLRIGNISDMDLTSTSLGSKEAVSCINNSFKNLKV